MQNPCLQRLKKVVNLFAVKQQIAQGLLAVAWQLRRKFETPFEVRAKSGAIIFVSKCIARDGRDHDCLDETAPHLVTPW